jgi:hypothetical protein
MNFHIPFFRKAAEPIAELRDELIRKGTEALLWEQMYRSAVRRRREPRRDKAAVIEAKRARTAELEAKFGRRA